MRAARLVKAFRAHELPVARIRVALAGIRTAIAVESTARTGLALNYAQVVATDAISDTSAEAHDNSVRRILPRLSRLARTEDIIAALNA